MKPRRVIMLFGLILGSMVPMSAGLPSGSAMDQDPGRNRHDRGDPRHGLDVFVANCAPCHEQELPDLKVQPPHLEGIFQRKRLPSGAPATDAQVRKTIIHGRGTMPAFDQRLGDADLRDMLSYLHNLK